MPTKLKEQTSVTQLLTLCNFTAQEIELLLTCDTCFWLTVSLWTSPVDERGMTLTQLPTLLFSDNTTYQCCRFRLFAFT